MSFFKFWGKKNKSKDDLDLRREETDPEAEKRKLRHTLSISRSGRFKQKKRDRGGILDRPELYGGDAAPGDFKDFKDFKDMKENTMYSETSSSASTTSTSSAMSSSSSSTTGAPSSSSSSPHKSSYPYPYPHQGGKRSGHT